MSKHKKQHFIPRCYLKAWCDPDCPSNHDPYIWIFDKETREGKNKSPGNVFHETDMYTIIGSNGCRDLTIEHGLRELETQFATIRNKKIKRLVELDTEEWIIICAFIAAMHARTPRHREHVREQWSYPLEIMDDIDMHMKSATVQEKQDMARISRVASSTTEGKGMSHNQVKALVANPLQHSVFPMIKAETPLLAGMDYTIFNTKSSPGFITTDYPVVWYDPEAYKRPPLYRDPGLMYPTIEVTMPLSPNQCIVLHRQGQNGHIDVSDDIVFQINSRNLHYADKHFIVNQNALNENWYDAGEEPQDKTHGK